MFSANSNIKYLECAYARPIYNLFDHVINPREREECSEGGGIVD